MGLFKVESAGIAGQVFRIGVKLYMLEDPGDPLPALVRDPQR